MDGSVVDRIIPVGPRIRDATFRENMRATLEGGSKVDHPKFLGVALLALRVFSKVWPWAWSYGEHDDVEIGIAQGDDCRGSCMLIVECRGRAVRGRLS
jgi:hypothetical protein